MISRLVTPLVERYLAQCQVRNVLVEDEGVDHPPTPEEVSFLIKYLDGRKLDPTIMGSVAALSHLGSVEGFRPTVDLDVWVKKDPGHPPEGWRRDPGAPGLTSWLSPTGGIVDFITPGHEFPGGSKSPKAIDRVDIEGYPVVGWKTILRMKLNSNRPKDLSDCMMLVKKFGVPPIADMGKMTATQRDNYELLTLWAKHSQ